MGSKGFARSIVVPAALAVLAACGPDAASPARVAVLDLGPSGYRLVVKELDTLDDPEALRGEAARFFVGAGFRAVGEEPFLGAAVRGDPAPPRAAYVESGGVLWPADFHSLGLATAYAHLEEVRAYALARGLPPGLLRAITVHYAAALDDGAAGVHDNAAWSSSLNAMILYPIGPDQRVPLPMNLGAIAHEYGHALFSTLVYDGQAAPPAALAWCEAARTAGHAACESAPEARLGLRMLVSVEEGLADAWAVAVSGDPTFVRRSLPGQSASRDVTRLRCLEPGAFATEVAETAALPLEHDRAHWRQRRYAIGTVLAGALHAAAQEVGWDPLLETALRSYGTTLREAMEQDPTGAGFGRFETIALALVRAADDARVRTALCRHLPDRLGLEPGALGGACDGVAPEGACP